MVGTVLTATLTDPDGSLSGATWVWASSTDGSTGWTDISGAASASYTPVAGDAGKYLRATATYTDGEGEGKSAQGVSHNAVQAAPVTNGLRSSRRTWRTAMWRRTPLLGRTSVGR